MTEKSPCSICADARRDASLVCVVERAVDILSIEKSGTYRGKFHVLGGKISPLDGVEPEDLRIAELEKRLTQEPIKEIIIALGTDVEGDATSHYLAKRLARKGLKISRIAYGLPAGSGLEFADELTLSRALEGRREMSVNTRLSSLISARCWWISITRSPPAKSPRAARCRSTSVNSFFRRFRASLSNTNRPADAAGIFRAGAQGHRLSRHA